MRRVPFHFGVALLGLLIAGCAALPGSKPPSLDTYELTAPAAEARSGRSRTQLLVAEPTALKSLDSENIVVKTGPASVEFLKGAQWADRLPRIIQARLAETLQRSGGFAGVGKPGEGLAIDYQIVTEIRSFEIAVGNGERAEVELFVRILNDRNGTVRASRVFTAAAGVAGSGNDAYAAALDRAFGEVAVSIVEWTRSVI